MTIKIQIKEAPKEFPQYDEVDLSPECLPEPVFKEMKSPDKKDPETGKVTATGITYYSAPLIHKTRGPDGKLRVDKYFQVEGPVMRSNGGIAIRRKDDGKYEASIFVSHDIENKDMAKFVGEPIDAEEFGKMPEKNVRDEEGKITEHGKESVGFMSQLHLRLLLFAFEKRDNIGIKGCRKLANFEGKFGHPLKFNCNPDGSIMLGKNPTKYWKVFLMGNPEGPGKCRKANFSMPVPISEENPDGELVLDWCFLQEVELVFKPLITFKSVYSGGDKIYIISEISSGVVLNFTPINNSCLQTITLNKVREDTALLENLQEQLAKAKEAIAKNGKPTLKLTEIEKKDEDGGKKGKGNMLKFEEDDEPKAKKTAKKQKDDEEEEEQPKKSSKKDVVIHIDDEPKKSSKKAPEEDAEITLKKPIKTKKPKEVEPEDGEPTELA